MFKKLSITLIKYLNTQQILKSGDISMPDQQDNLQTRKVLIRMLKGIMLGIPIGFFSILLSVLINALAGNIQNVGLEFIENPNYMFIFGEAIGVGIEILPELDKE
jgi:hypothetical protein